MSADNFYVLRKHPLGGFALIMGFASDENDTANTCAVPKSAESFPTTEAALKAFSDGQEWQNEQIGWYPRYYCEYGLSVNSECFEVELTTDKFNVWILHPDMTWTTITIAGHREVGYSVTNYDLDTTLPKAVVVL